MSRSYVVPLDPTLLGCLQRIALFLIYRKKKDEVTLPVRFCQFDTNITQEESHSSGELLSSDCPG